MGLVGETGRIRAAADWEGCKILDVLGERILDGEVIPDGGATCPWELQRWAPLCEEE